MQQFRFVCFDLSDTLLARFKAALPADLASHFQLVAGDLNAQQFDEQFDAVMANHSLHHIVDLEGVFRIVYANLAPNGIFVTNDMIGRNGHMRWPEARLFVDFFWPFLKQSQRNNILMRRCESRYIDHDCSTSGFEGIRAQDILPLILEQGFHPWKFLSFGGMVDIFVDRCFGPNFNLDNPDDAFLASRISFLNEVLLDAGLVKPTMMLAYFTKTEMGGIHFRGRSAEATVRATTTEPTWLAAALEDFSRRPDDPEFVFPGACLRAADDLRAPSPIIRHC